VRSDADAAFAQRLADAGSFPLALDAPARVGRLKAYGNAIVPQQAALFIRAVMPLIGLKPAG
jgi:DNA (cytosine-5)-methyltransferase 1